MTQPLSHREPPALHDRALDDLSYIRRTMEGAVAFTDVSGLGLALVGLSALAAAFFASRQPSIERWLTIWIVEAIIACTLAMLLMYRKMRRRQPGAAGLSVPARKFLLAFWPAIIVGAVVTIAIVTASPAVEPYVGLASTAKLLAGIWLLLYGVAVMGAGAYSVRAVPLLGVVFLILGTVTLLVPIFAADLMLAAGFGVAQFVVGIHIARSYGG